MIPTHFLIIPNSFWETSNFDFEQGCGRRHCVGVHVLFVGHKGCMLVECKGSGSRSGGQVLAGHLDGGVGIVPGGDPHGDPGIVAHQPFGRFGTVVTPTQYWMEQE